MTTSSLVVHQKGKEARTILRYPTIPPELPLDDASDNGAHEEDLFFRMDPRQMAKLFRPKPSLCGQPMTLSAGGTIFCCRAVLLEEDRDAEHIEDQSQDEDDMDQVEFFSIIVALVPRGEMILSIAGGWFEEERNIKGILGSPQKGTEDAFSNKATAAFLAVIRVHLSLARLCAVLEREEHRCQYITLQSVLILNVRKALRTLEGIPNATSPVSLSSKLSANKPPRPGGALMDQAGQSKVTDSEASVENFDREQEILETVMAAVLPVDPVSNIQHKGNLARELVQFFHNLAQSEDDLSDISLRILGGEGVLYVNGHIAVSVEGLLLRGGLDRNGSSVRPYETLLFPCISRKDLLESLSTASSTSTVPRRLQQLLLSANPLKSLADIAKDSNLPQQVAVDIASYLVGQGVAVASHVISPRSLLACSGIQQIENAALSFSYMFGPDVDIFNLVAFLTSAGTLGNAIMSVVSSEDNQARILRTMLRRSITSTKNNRGVTLLRPVSVGLSLEGGEEISEMEHAVELEDMLYKMVVWLCGRAVIVQLVEFMIEPASPGEESKVPESEKSEKKVEDHNSDEMLLHDLRKNACLDGSMSLNAIAWKLGTDVRRLRAFAEENRHKIRIVARMA